MQLNRRERSLRQGSWLERGCKSHPSVHDGTRPQQRRREAGLEAEEDEQTGRNESEPHLMSLETPQTGDKPSLSLLGEGRWERVGQQPASAQRSGGVRVDSTSARQVSPAARDGRTSAMGDKSQPSAQAGQISKAGGVAGEVGVPHSSVDLHYFKRCKEPRGDTYSTRRGEAKDAGMAGAASQTALLLEHAKAHES